jgi:hypothetical protein
MWDRLAAMDSWRLRIGRGILAGLVGWGLVEGAVFPLCESARLELRPASEFVKAHAHGETVIVGDHVSAYYLRHQSGVYLWNEVTAFPPGRVWVVGVFDQRVPDTVTPLLARGSRSVSRRDFGPITVFQLSASGCQE